jgi:hypothetical protein
MKTSPKNTDTPRGLVSDTSVRRELGDLTRWALARWDNDPTVGFPPPITIHGRKYRDRQAVNEWIEAQKMRAIAEHTDKLKRQAAARAKRRAA